VKQEAGGDLARQVELSFQLALSRPPKPFELRESTAFVAGNGLADFCLALFNLNEFVYMP
jgi:hypothetical protein